MPKNDFNRKIKDFDTFIKIAKNLGDLGNIIAARGFKKLPKSNKSLNLVTLAAANLKFSLRCVGVELCCVAWGPIYFSTSYTFCVSAPHARTDRDLSDGRTISRNLNVRIVS